MSNSGEAWYLAESGPGPTGGAGTPFRRPGGQVRWHLTGSIALYRIQTRQTNPAVTGRKTCGCQPVTPTCSGRGDRGAQELQTRPGWFPRGRLRCRKVADLYASRQRLCSAVLVSWQVSVIRAVDPRIVLLKGACGRRLRRRCQTDGSHHADDNQLFPLPLADYTRLGRWAEQPAAVDTAVSSRMSGAGHAGEARPGPSRTAARA